MHLVGRLAVLYRLMVATLQDKWLQSFPYSLDQWQSHFDMKSYICYIIRDSGLALAFNVSIKRAINVRLGVLADGGVGHFAQPGPP